MTRIRARDRLAVFVEVTPEDRAVLRAESMNMAWDLAIERAVAEAPPLSLEQLERLRVLFGR